MYLQNFLIICILYHCTNISLQKNQSKPIRWEYFRIEDYPYVVWVFNQIALREGIGVIIGEKWVLTAAHFLKSTVAQRIQIVAARQSWNISEYLYSIEKKPVLFKIHPNYGENSASDDIALLKVEPPFELSSRVNILTLAEHGRSKNINLNKCEVVEYVNAVPEVTRLSKQYVPRNRGPRECKCWFREDLICVDFKKGDGCPIKKLKTGLLVCDGKGVGLRSFTYNPQKYCPAGILSQLFSKSDEDDLSDDVFPINKIKENLCKVNKIAAYVYIPSKLKWISKYVPNIYYPSENIHNAESYAQSNAQTSGFLMYILMFIIKSFS